MSKVENKDVILRWFEAVNQGDIPQLDRLADEIFTADFVLHDPRVPDFEPGPAGVKKFIHQVRSEYKGVQVTVHDMLMDGDKVAYRFTLSMKDGASGEPVNAQLLAIDRFVDGQIVEEWQLSARGKW